ncbi:MAG: primosomal protein N' [Oscillospiraceae bacterium]|nr:primosomal protein N' [Oscillospiraceae bacterium]
MPDAVAKIAVSAAPYWIDKPYEYAVPNVLQGRVQPGIRVAVPFSAGNRRSEGIVLALSDRADYGKLKDITEVLDDEPVLTPQQIQLALFMRERFFCTVYDAVRAMLPVGLWFDREGRRRVSDKTVEVIRLTVSAREALDAAEAMQKHAPAQARILRELAPYGEMPLRELLLFTGCARTTVKKLLSSGLAEMIEREVFRIPEFSVGVRQKMPVLNDEQQSAFEGLDVLASSGKAAVSLLEGVTGSGKTSVYIRLIDAVLKRGKSAILLVPEIALTPQMLYTFSSYFGDDIAVLHSSLSPGERYDEWKRLKNGRAHVAIGTRSAVFAPVDNLGILIIDEEQEDTYRSENNPRYDARDVAKYRCFKSGCLLVLGSATPDLVTRYFAEDGRYSHFVLRRRYNELKLPEVKIVDLKNELRRGNDGSISAPLRAELDENLERGEQSILFLNRRGAHKLVTCGECGFVYKCPHCSVSLTYHSVNRRLICHYCGYTRRVDETCPDCGGILKYIGAGTQLVEEELHSLFPGTEILRMDADVLSGTVTHEQVFERFRTENIPIMIGTQMVTKGLNFENVTLVGVLSADQSLYSGDFRAAEKTFSLITQVIGRSGRGQKAGRAVIQTFTPSSEVIQQAARQDYDAFYQSEIVLRKLQDSPPFSDLLSITASGSEERAVVDACRFVKYRLAFLLQRKEKTEFLGPTPLTVVRVNNRFRYRIIIKCRSDSAIRNAVSGVITECSTDKRFRGITFYADNDPEF